VYIQWKEQTMNVVFLSPHFPSQYHQFCRQLKLAGANTLFFFKHPDLFEWTLALSGLYRLDRHEYRLDRHEFGLESVDIPAVYFNSPLNYLESLSDPELLKQLRNRTIVICAGQGAWDEESLADTQHLETICKAKSIPAWIDIWGHDVNHDWPWWYKQMNYFLENLYGRA